MSIMRHGTAHVPSTLRREVRNGRAPHVALAQGGISRGSGAPSGLVVLLQPLETAGYAYTKRQLSAA